MLNHLQAAARLLVLASIGLFTSVVLLLIQSAFWSNRVSGWMQLVILATALLSYFRPQYGLLALAALVPFGRTGSGTLDSQMRGAEALVLAFLAGALVRGWTLREFRSIPSTRLETAALIFGFIVAASCIEQIWFLQIQRNYPWPFLQEVLTYSSRNYVTSYRGFGMIFHAMLMLEGLALLLYAIRYCRKDPRFARQFFMMVMLGAVCTGIFNIGYVAFRFSQLDVSTRLVDFFSARRWTVHIGDVNAAASSFVMAMFICIGLAVNDRERRLLWSGGAAILAVALVMTGSRTGLAAAAVIAVFGIGRAALHARPIRTLLPMTIAIAVLGAAVWYYVSSRTFYGAPAYALRIRWLFLETTARMLASEPLFGIGIGQYPLWSGYFAPQELFQIYKRDNAHNNFAQIAGELGTAGLVAFLIVVVGSMWARSTGTEAGRVRGPILLGLAAFLLTWLGGHPLLIPEVVFPFWMLLAVLAAAGAPPATFSISGVLVVVMLLAISLPLRVERHIGRVDLSRVRYGLTSRHMMSSRTRFFVPADKPQVQVPLRARGASDETPVRIAVSVDGVARNDITIASPEWQTVRVRLPGSSAKRFHEVELRIAPSGEAEDADPDRSPVEVGNWEIISKPNG
jgi:O-antigen ligase